MIKMKSIKILLSLIAVATFAAMSCRKLPDNVSTVEVASYPTITISGSQFYSIPVNGALPNISATAYDSVIKESYLVTLDASGIDVTTPGLYVVAIQAKNKFGYIGSKNVAVAVTDIADTWNLSGEYRRTSNNALVNLTKVANGLYEVDNVGGAPTFAVLGYFIQINDSTIDFPLQPTDLAGQVDCINETLTISGSDTSYAWNVVNPNFGPAFRTFEKQ